MYRGVTTILLCVLPFNYATYLPSVFWDTANPILQEQFWQEVVQVKLFDTITFICPNDNIRMRGSETTSMIDGLYHNLYVKEVPAIITSFDGVCDTSEYSTSKFIANCIKPKEFNYRNIPINVNQADSAAIPEFQSGRDYMFFATSDGTQKSLRTRSKNCTMVFRIHFGRNDPLIPFPSCPLFGRRNVCEKPSESKTKECEDIIPQELNVTTNTANKVTVTWKQPSNPSCNITYYTVCYRERLAEPCKEALVPAKQQDVALCELAADKKYIIQVRAHTAKGPGDYCKAKSFDTGGTKECEDIIPQELNVTTNTANKVTVTWKQPSNPSCNITYYTVCYREHLTEPCKEALVPAKQQDVTLCELTADKKYIIQVRAHTAKGPGDYSKAKSFDTSSLFDTEPTISAQKDDKNTSIDGKSIGIGFMIGVILTVILGIAFWLFITRIYRRKFKVNNEKEDENTSRNNPIFYTRDGIDGGCFNTK